MIDSSRVAICIPCYNEAQTIAKVIADYRAVFPLAKIFVFDNNSTDDSAALAKAAGAKVVAEPRQGKGNVIRTIFRTIHADCLILTDGDDTYPAEDALKLARAVLEDGADMAIGDRLSSTYFTENKRRKHRDFASPEQVHNHRLNAVKKLIRSDKNQQGRGDCDNECVVGVELHVKLAE